MQLLTKSGEERIIAWHNTILRDENGNITAALSSGEDITERNHAEKLLKESEEKFRSVSQSAADAIISVDSSGKIVFWNRAAEEMFDYQADEILGKPLTIIMPERFHEAHQKGMNRVVLTGESNLIGKTIEFTGVRRDGMEFPSGAFSFKMEYRKGQFFYCYYT